MKTIDRGFLQQCFNEAMAGFGYPEINVYLNSYPEYTEYGEKVIFVSEDYIVY